MPEENELEKKTAAITESFKGTSRKVIIPIVESGRKILDDLMQDKEAGTHMHRMAIHQFGLLELAIKGGNFNLAQSAYAQLFDTGVAQRHVDRYVLALCPDGTLKGKKSAELRQLEQEAYQAFGYRPPREE